MDAFEREWRARFEHFARGYTEDHLVSGWSRLGLQRRIEAVGRLLHGRLDSTPLRMLDLGCGAGTYVRWFSGMGHRVVGFDYSGPSLRRARHGDRDGAGTYVQGEAYRLPFRPASFDAVVAIGIFQALGSAETAIDQILRVLRPGGWAVLETLNAAAVISVARQGLARIRRRRHPVRAYSPYRVRSWLSARGADPQRQVGIYLPPRGAAWLAPAFEPRALPAVLEAIPGAPLLAAHAFLTLARKRD